MGSCMSRALALLLAASVLGACAEPSPEPEPKTARFDDLSLDQALAWFEERTLACVGPERPFADPREWLCTHEFEDSSRIEVRIIADRAGVSQIVGVASGLNAEDSASFLGSTVAVLAVPEREREALTLWAHQHAETGGDRVAGRASVHLQAHSANRAVIVTAVP